MAADTMFRVASMTKPITATALMILVDEGKLSIDDPVEKYLPAFADAKLADGTPVRGLKIRHLLTHTSGLTGEQECETSLAATADMLAKRPFSFQPGEKWEYGPSLNVCGRIIEVVSGKPYEEFIGERILRPLEMFNTTFHPTDKQWQRVATVYKPAADAGTLVPVPNDKLKITGAADSVPSPSGGLFSTADDMVRFYQVILNGGKLGSRQIVSAEAVEAMTTPQTGDLVTGFTPGNAWGLGWCVVREPQDVTAMLSPGTFGHGGLYGTQGWVDPEKKRIFVLMYQREDIGNSDGSDIRRDFQNAAVKALESK
jgi:CubicO group peptidase (beta-lactamase class C family)